MSRRGLRLILVVIFHLALGGAAYQIWRVEVRMDRDRAARMVFSEQAARAVLALADVRAAQQAYVAIGQTPEFWSAQVAERAAAIMSGLTQLRATATADAARGSLAEAAAAMADFGPIDRRAREQVAMNQPLTASDLIFADGLETLQRASASTDAAAKAQDAAFANGLAAARQEELVTVAGALAVILLITWVLVPTARARDRKQTSPVSGAPPDARTASGSEGESPVQALDARLSGVPTESATPARRVDFGAVAQLCTDLGRVGDTIDLPGMLGRAARLLDAHGIVLWIADPAGNELLPSIAHGYATQALSRIGGLRRDSDNATAASYRSGSLQIVASEPGQHGAIIAPLLTVSGCVGVMAVEVRNQGERDEEIKAASSLVAAQLAALVSAAPSVAESPAATRVAQI